MHGWEESVGERRGFKLRIRLPQIAAVYIWFLSLARSSYKLPNHVDAQVIKVAYQTISLPAQRLFCCFSD